MASMRSRRVSALLMALVVVLSLLLSSTCGAQRLLKTQDVEAATPTRALVEVVANSTANSTDDEATATTESMTTSAASTEAESTTATTTTAEASESGKTHAKGPSLSSFTGPMIAGAVAIVLIGFVIAFKNRGSH